MKIMFFGTPDFAIPCLEMLIKEGYEIPCVITQPDRKSGRGHKINPTPVKAAAMEHNISVYQPESIKNGELNELLNEHNPDMIVVVAYGKILPEEVLKFPKYGCINVHGSLLPKLRGAAPIQRSLMNGDKITGVTTMLMDKGMDTGDILYTSELEIEEDETCETLFDKLKVMGAELLKTTIIKIKDGKAVRIKQNEEEATYAPMIHKEDTVIDWSKSFEELKWQMMGLSPAPGAATLLNGKKLKVFNGIKGEACEDTDYGKIWGYFEDKGLGVVCGGSIFYITDLQIENSRRMPVSEFVKGHKIEPGEVLG